MSLAYCPEIDGFRALAVGVVVLFHAWFPGFSHGFVGVDIFVVISGFLITSIIAREQAGAGFSYGDFVLSRVRRILPALVVVMLACLPFAWGLMLPDPLENFGQSLIATTFSANNILLWLTTGYWDLGSDYKPLLHTWSLGVEEQFYIFYPFLLLALCLQVPEFIRLRNDGQKAELGKRYVDLLSENGGRMIRATDANGVLLTTDRVHLSQASAINVADHLPELFPEIYALAGTGTATLQED